MDRLTKTFFIALILLILCGCSPTASETKNFRGQERYIQTYLPLGAENVRPLGNEWVLFDFEINVKPFNFLI